MGDKNRESGYRHGQEDGATGSGKSVFKRPVARMLKPDAFLPGGGNRVEEYIDGYSQGYEDNIKVLNVRDSGQNQENKRNESMATTSYEQQEQLLNELYQHLGLLQQNLDAAARQYQRVMDELEPLMIQNIHKHFTNHAFIPTNHGLQQLNERLTDVDMKMTLNAIQAVQDQIRMNL